MTSHLRSRREDGVSMVELLIAFTVFGAILLSVGMTLVSGMAQRRESFQIYQAMVALRDKVSEIQEIANLAQDLTRQEGIGAIYDRYNDTVTPVNSVPSGEITILCFPNEATVPGTFGGPQDLNFDGDSGDDLGNVSNGSDLKLVPMELTISFRDGNFTHDYTIHRLITMTEDDAAFSTGGVFGGPNQQNINNVSPGD